MSPDDTIAVRLERDGYDWRASARRGGVELVAANAESPGEVLEAVGQELDAEEAARVTAAKAAESSRRVDHHTTTVEAAAASAYMAGPGGDAVPSGLRAAPADRPCAYCGAEDNLRCCEFGRDR